MNIAIEGLIFSDENLIYKFEDWLKRKPNVLLVTGLSGSGKSTLSKQLMEKYNAIVLELDLFEHNRFLYTYMKTGRNEKNLTLGERIIREYFDLTYGGVKDWSNTPDDEFISEFRKFFQHISYKAKEMKNRLFIFEGLQLTTLCQSFQTELWNLPCIVMGASVMKSMIQRLGREGRKEMFQNNSPLKLLQWYIDRDRKLQIFRNNVGTVESFMSYVYK